MVEVEGRKKGKRAGKKGKKREGEEKEGREGTKRDGGKEVGEGRIRKVKRKKGGEVDHAVLMATGLYPSSRFSRRRSFSLKAT